MKSITFIAFLLTSVLALPYPSTLTGEALEKELEFLNAPEPWEKRVVGRFPFFTLYNLKRALSLAFRPQ